MRSLVVLLMLVIATAAQAQVAVVNVGVRDAVDRDHLRNILLGRITTWADGSQVVLILSTDPASRAAIEDLTGRDLERLLRGWKRILFSGNGAMPITATSANEALEAAAQRPGAIAIIGVVPPADQRIRVVVTLGAAVTPAP
jgi:hypothetical protein